MASFLNLDNGRINFNVRIPDVTDSTSWNIIAEESYQPDKEAYIVEAFERDFPAQYKALVDALDNKELGNIFTKLMGTISRSTALTRWLSGITAAYSLEANLPVYMKDYVSKEDFKKAQTEVNKYNRVVKSESEERQKAAEEYKLKMEDIDKKFSKQKDVYLNNNLLTIITLQANRLPLSIALKIENYTPQDDAAPSQRYYARELLTTFKICLLEILRSDPTININSLIDSLATL